MLNKTYLEILENKYDLKVELLGRDCMVGDFVINTDISSSNYGRMLQLTRKNNNSMFNDGEYNYTINGRSGWTLRPNQFVGVKISGSSNLLLMLFDSNAFMLDTRRKNITMELVYLLNSLLLDTNDEAIAEMLRLENSKLLFDMFKVFIMKNYMLTWRKTFKHLINNQSDLVYLGDYHIKSDGTVSEDIDDYVDLTQYMKTHSYKSLTRDIMCSYGYFRNSTTRLMTVLFINKLLYSTHLFTVDSGEINIISERKGINMFNTFYMNNALILCEGSSDKIETTLQTMNNDMVIVNGRFVTASYASNLNECPNCGRYHVTLMEHDGVPMCARCFSNNYYECAECGATESYANVSEMFDNFSRMGMDVQDNICKDCATTHYSIVCPFNTGNNGHTGNCFTCPKASTCLPFIQSWDFRPNFILYGNASKEFTYGIEVELDKGGRDYTNFVNIRGNNKELYAKQDGSIDNGFEIVGHPMTYDYIKTINWEGIFSRASNLGYRSHDTSTCGLHVHVGRNHLDGDRHIAKIVKSVHTLWDDFARFSRRNINRLDEWSKKPRVGTYDSDSDIICKNDNDRYVAVNLTNRHTIEFRMFRGTLKSDTFLASIQLVKNLVEMTKRNGSLPTNFIDIVNYKRYDELDRYMGYLDERDSRRGSDFSESSVTDGAADGASEGVRPSPIVGTDEVAFNAYVESTEEVAEPTGFTTYTTSFNLAGGIVNASLDDNGIITFNEVSNVDVRNVDVCVNSNEESADDVDARDASVRGASSPTRDDSDDNVANIADIDDWTY